MRDALLFATLDSDPSRLVGLAGRPRITRRRTCVPERTIHLEEF